MNDKELLLGTMKAIGIYMPLVVIIFHIVNLFSSKFIGNPEMEKEFQTLITLQANLKAVSTNVSKDEQEVEKLRRDNARAEGEVNLFKEREALKASKLNLEKKKAWIEHEDQWAVCEQAYGVYKDLKKQYEKASSRFKPLETKISEGESLIKKSQASLSQKVSLQFLSQLLVLSNCCIYSALI